MSSLPKTPTVNEWLRHATHELIGAGIGSAKLDAEIILAHTLRSHRTFLHAHGDNRLTDRQTEVADARLSLRSDRTPLAYIIGHKEFYGRLFKVTPATLVPRPESETIIDLLKELAPRTLSLLDPKTTKLVDIGTGTGCLGITAKLEFPDIEVTLCDISRHALKVAETNAQQLGAEVTIMTSNLLEGYPLTPAIILANLPYVDRSWERSPETNYEPEIALFAGSGGLQLIDRLLSQAVERLAPGGLLFLEADPRQHATIVRTAKVNGFGIKDKRGFILVFVKP